jgi:hypothetical protein
MDIEGITQRVASAGPTLTDALADKLSREAPEERNAGQALRDLTLPESLTTRLAQLFEELGYTLDGCEIPDRAGDGSRKVTRASRSEAEARHFLHIPYWILNDPNDPNPTLVSGLGSMLPKKLRVFVLSEGLQAPAEYWDTVAAPNWRYLEVDAKFIPWRRVTEDLTTKKRDAQLRSIQTMFDLETNGAQPSPVPAPPSAAPSPAATAPRKRPYVFISYSWDSDEHKEKALTLAYSLRQYGVDASIDQWEMWPKQGWALWCQEQVEKADFVLVVCTENYKSRVERKQSPSPDGEPVGRGATWEGMVITNEIYNSTEGQTKYIPIVFGAGGRKHVPVFLQGFSVYDVDTDEGWESMYRLVTDQRRYTPPPLGDIVKPDQLEQPNLGPARW